MAKKSKRSGRKKWKWTNPLAKGEATDKDRADDVAKMLFEESDRGCAIFASALLEDDLEALLRAFCRNDQPFVKQVIDPLFRTYAPLATFSAKIQVAFVLRLITWDLKQGLDLVRRIRNDLLMNRAH